MSIPVLCLFFKLHYLIFCYRVVGVPYMFWILIPYQIDDLQVVALIPPVTFSFCGLFHLLCRKKKQKLFSLMQPPLIYRCFGCLCFWCHSQEITGIRGRINQEFGINIYTQLYIKQIINKDLLYSTGNSTQCSVITSMGK